MNHKTGTESERHWSGHSCGNWNRSYATIVPQLSKCLKFEAVWGVLTDQMI